MTEEDFIGGMADLEAQLKAGNALSAEVRDALLALLKKQAPAPQVSVSPAVTVQAPAVSVPVTVQSAPAPAYDWEHRHIYDGDGRLVKTISTRVAHG
jgi:hypothetical protein